MKTKLYLRILLLLSLFLTNCSSSGKNLPKGFDYGEVKDNIYLNTFFDFSMNIPSGWVIQDKEQADELMQMGKDMIAGDDKKMKAVLDASYIKTANLLTVFQYELNTPEIIFNPSLAIVAENIKLTPGIKTGADYLTHGRKFMEQTQMYDYISEEFEKETINGVDFYILEAIIEFGEIEILQKYYVTILNNFALSFIVTSGDEEQQDILMKSMRSIKFN